MILYCYDVALSCGVVWYEWFGVKWWVWCGVVWWSVVWNCMVWYGEVWCGILWCGIAWCGMKWWSSCQNSSASRLCICEQAKMSRAQQTLRPSHLQSRLVISPPASHVSHLSVTRPPSLHNLLQYQKQKHQHKRKSWLYYDLGDRSCYLFLALSSHITKEKHSEALLTWWQLCWESVAKQSGPIICSLISFWGNSELRRRFQYIICYARLITLRSQPIFVVDILLSLFLLCFLWSRNICLTLLVDISLLLLSLLLLLLSLLCSVC